MKKVLSFILSFVILFNTVAAVGFSAYAQTQKNYGKCGAECYWSYDAFTRSLTIRGRGEMYDYSNTNRPPWYSISGDGVEHLFIRGGSDGISRIGNYAFANMSILSQIEIPDSVITIGNHAFYYCSADSLIIGNHVSEIESYAFCGFNFKKTDASRIIIPDSVETIGVQAFGKRYYDYIVIGRGVGEIKANGISVVWGTTVFYMGSEEDKELINIEKSPNMLNPSEWICIKGYAKSDVPWFEPNCIYPGVTYPDDEESENQTAYFIAPLQEHSFTQPANTDLQNYYNQCSMCGCLSRNSTENPADNFALISLLNKSASLADNDYSASSYDNFMEIYQHCLTVSELPVEQAAVDAAISELLTAITELEPYFNFSLTSNASVKPDVLFDGIAYGGDDATLLFGTAVMLTAPDENGYRFDCWYDTVSRRVLSTDNTYSFRITSNLRLEARYVPLSSATLTFANESGQVSEKITKDISEWSNMDSIDSLLPDVPYSFGRVNGRWNYDNSYVLSQLRSGNAVTITPVYDAFSTVEPDSIISDSTTSPTASLKYEYSQGMGSFIMSVDIPTECRVNSIGIAFYRDNSNEFDPSQLLLDLNNKNIISQFNIDTLDNIYIVNANTTGKSWASVGYITYLDGDKLVTCYTNQINIINNAEI